MKAACKTSLFAKNAKFWTFCKVKKGVCYSKNEIKTFCKL